MGLQSLPAGPLNILQAQKMFLQAQLRWTVAPGRPLSAPLATPLSTLSWNFRKALVLNLFQYCLALINIASSNRHKACLEFGINIRLKN